MKLFRLFTGDDGEAQMEVIDLADRPEFSELQTAKAVVRTYPGGHDFGRHTAPRRQYVTCVEGEAEVELDDGSVYRFIPGSWLLAEDMTGRGHRSRAVGERPLVLAMIHLGDT
jgi:quercetin dioxygenase-like cupin family protein